MARGETTDPAVKGAVLAALLTGQSVDSVANEYKIPNNTVKTWKRIADEKIRIAAESEVNGQYHTSLLDAYLTQTLKTITVQQELFGDREWLLKQNAADLAVLHGVTVDKALRLWEAIEKQQPKPDGETPTN